MLFATSTRAEAYQEEVVTSFDRVTHLQAVASVAFGVSGFQGVSLDPEKQTVEGVFGTIGISTDPQAD